ncbi:unnamed protein product [Heligmosomoides polygyrus]|uniref:Uncharacterized protein n=1 Tax=Heligmosomoides polygyrus TaxID=6339 RepID=A0A3P7ZS61_HELPZ|nr:unnamed protein product [Heligmosomoides polygyrus]
MKHIAYKADRKSEGRRSSIVSLLEPWLCARSVEALKTDLRSSSAANGTIQEGSEP